MICDNLLFVCYFCFLQVESLHEEANLLDVELTSLRRVVTDAGGQQQHCSSSSNSSSSRSTSAPTSSFALWTPYDQL
jgi:hypothetical protein